MKRFTILLALVLMVAMPSFAKRVTSETARKVANTFLNNNGTKSVQLTDLSKEAGFPNLYIFNGNPGFVVMAADDCVQPILGYSLTGRFVAENMPTNVSGWLQGYNDEIQYAIDSKMSATAETAKLWKDLIEGNSKAAKATAIVPNLLKTEWNQDPLYNNYCPYDNTASELTVTGCVATAMAQIMKYWDYPTSGTGSHSYNHSTYGTQSANYGNTTYHWENMPAYLSSSSTTEQINEVAQLMYHCGVSVEMTYGLAVNGGSSASTQEVGNALMTYFKYSSGITYKQKSRYSDTNWKNLVKAELDAGRPLQYRGQGTGGGHSFICCGYDSDDKFYFNWGWSGSNDGFYALNSLVPGSGGSGGGSYSFTDYQAALFGIQPMATTTSTPTNFNLATEGRNAILTWDATESAASYYVYRDGLAIANTTATTYTDNDLGYGSYDYYIKSRDANGASAAPTETLTAVIEPKPTNLTVTKSGNNATLNWTAPEWLLPSTDEEMLTYGDGSIAYIYGNDDGSNYYVGQRYTTSMLASNKVLYKVSFYAVKPGNFTLLVYKSNAGANYPDSPAVLEQPINTTLSGWVEIAVTSLLQLDETKDLWVFIYDPEGKEYPFAIGTYSGSDGGYYSYDPYNPTTAIGAIGGGGYAVLLRTCITDGDFTYNLYQDGTKIAQDLNATTYNATLNNNAANLFVVKTNFKGSETEASNKIGFAKGTVSIASLELAINDQMTVTEGSKLTVNGTLSDVDASNLILEDGAQLINGSTGVQATVHKNIDAYGEKNGWNFIASPMTSLTVDNETHTNIASNNFDLYRFNQSPSPTTMDGRTVYLEWENWKKQGTDHYHFDLEPGKGYLYAHNPTIDAVFIGELANPQNGDIQVSYSTSNPSLDMHGWNLIGNPFTCNAYINRSYYRINNDGNGIQVVENNAAILPCTGILVKTENPNGETVTFTKEPQTNGAKGSLNITLANANTRNNAIVDNAIVTFNKDNELGKFYFGQSNANIYFPKNGEDYAIAYAHGMDEMPLNFRADENGSYTLTINPKDIELDYLHLIDNMTGANVDLLATPSYTFEAKTTDYASRFRLLFAPISEDADSDNATFAFISDGNIVVNGEGILQIVDVTGRVIISRRGDVSGNVSTNGMEPGVYVLRLINGANMMTQKIVIE